MNLTLRQLRRCKDITQQEMANILGIHVQTYRKFETNPENIPVGHAKKISEYLDVSYDEIFFEHHFTKSRDLDTA